MLRPSSSNSIGDSFQRHADPCTGHTAEPTNCGNQLTGADSTLYTMVCSEMIPSMPIYVEFVGSADTPTPITLRVDEIDALVRDTVIAVLHQLVSLYVRLRRQPHSVILGDAPDVRDYRIQSSADRKRSTTVACSTSSASPCVPATLGSRDAPRPAHRQDPASIDRIRPPEEMASLRCRLGARERPRLPRLRSQPGRGKAIEANAVVAPKALIFGPKPFGPTQHTPHR